MLTGIISFNRHLVFEAQQQTVNIMNVQQGINTFVWRKSGLLNVFFLKKKALIGSDML